MLISKIKFSLNIQEINLVCTQFCKFWFGCDHTSTGSNQFANFGRAIYVESNLEYNL
jgi:hypothetical protein